MLVKHTVSVQHASPFYPILPLPKFYICVKCQELSPLLHNNGKCPACHAEDKLVAIARQHNMMPADMDNDM